MSAAWPPALLAAYEQARRQLAGQAKDLPLGERLRPVFGEGPAPAGVLLVGEAPGREETEAGRPFVGRAGQVLNALLAEAGIPRAALFVTNAVKYRPYRLSPKGTKSNRPPTRKELAAGRELLLYEMEAAAPRIVVTLGNSPLWALTGQAEVGALHGRPLAALGRTVFPLYHPASVLYRPALKDALQTDARALGELIKSQRTAGGAKAPAAE